MADSAAPQRPTGFVGEPPLTCDAPGCQAGPCRTAAPLIVALGAEVPLACPNRWALCDPLVDLPNVLAAQRAYLTPRARVLISPIPDGRDREVLTRLVRSGQLVVLKRRVQHEIRQVTPTDQPIKPEPPIIDPPVLRHQVVFQVVEDQTGEPIPRVLLDITLPNGKTSTERTRPDGRVEMHEVDPGTCRVECKREGARLDRTLAYEILGDTPSEGRPEPDIETFRAIRDAGDQLVLNVEAHQVSTGETIESLANANDMTWQELAEFNWNTRVPTEINDQLEIEVGCTQRTQDGYNYIFHDSDRPGLVYIPRDWSVDGLPTEAEHVIRVHSPQRRPSLESDFAWRQLCGVAEYFPKKDFWLWMMTIFGHDLPFEAFEELRQDLKAKKVKNPRIDLLDRGELGDAEGAFNMTRRRIEIDRLLPERAREDRDESWKLMVVLVEEFGHYIDHILRNEYTSIGGDATFDEGAAFAHALSLLKLDLQPATPYAEYFDGEREHTLEADHSEFMEAAQKYADIRSIFADEQDDEREYFGAGGGHGHGFGHESVEEKGFAASAAKPPFTKDEQKKIYFGNWERDYSQAICPALCRAPKAPWYTGFTRDALKSVIRILAKMKFGMKPAFNVTRANLRLYRAEDHIDNPFKIPDASKDDKQFNRACEKETDPALGVDAQARKVYIVSGGKGVNWPTAREYMHHELQQAINEGRDSNAGLRFFGNALHALEDFYAHSNYVELALRRLGRETGNAAMKAVDPWVPIGGGPGGRSVLTTGCFGGLDSAASILFEIGEKAQEAEQFKPGEPTSAERITLILITDLDENWGRYYATYLDLKTKAKDNFIHRNAAWAIHHTVGALIRAIKYILGGGIRIIANLIDEAQTVAGPDSTNPTHTQLAKDHHDRHFHALAAKLAIIAVAEMGTEMAKAWDPDDATAEVFTRATGFLVHPEDDPRLAEGGAFRKTIIDWAKGNSGELTRGASRTFVEHEWEQFKDAAFGWTDNISLEKLKQLLDDIID